MFKTKKTQFAIRKLAQGASAVLLCFGILGGASAPIVPAATTDDPTKTVTESTINSENTSFNIETTTNASDKFASISKNGGGYNGSAKFC
ncbi:YSIRK-type signal peptide-containing protein [Lactobacillus crispatus]|uniref:YSIRK-type signal peptide-containing protein n=1 Tax=Lactobacillus crispatus TaxID=47770 RepID=UPI000280B892|nr:YSIRK-type signal peptide-containing protein [Lactobacillus crispatus]EKB61887.1 YSIRK family Gram-positive signal peptide [Lactobacillus crispatus FB049-03]MBG0735217.1 YSIRK-type signal peptide-containing protein [Lactobacillus crispatus]MCZ3676038.1 YSIRK-type signal peptide-containing protein [Lactobacillus crispatus]MCZ3881632.1 YSIRK-type signal peptide-containing protein [Lactobacillus crispatus]MCZ3883900.1 YSIRK-type signal peptide-containing protein [Lactobacillus crispatus]